MCVISRCVCQRMLRQAPFTHVKEKAEWRRNRVRWVWLFHSIWRSWRDIAPLYQGSCLFARRQGVASTNSCVSTTFFSLFPFPVRFWRNFSALILSNWMLELECAIVENGELSFKLENTSNQTCRRKHSSENQFGMEWIVQASFSFSTSK